MKTNKSVISKRERKFIQAVRNRKPIKYSIERKPVVIDNFERKRLLIDPFLKQEARNEATFDFMKVERGEAIRQNEKLQKQLNQFQENNGKLSKDLENKNLQITKLTNSLEALKHNFEDLKKNKQPILKEMFKEDYNKLLEESKKYNHWWSEADTELKTAKEKIKLLINENEALKTQVEELIESKEKYKQGYLKWIHHLKILDLEPLKEIITPEKYEDLILKTRKEIAEYKKQFNLNPEQKPSIQTQQQPPLASIDVNKLREFLESDQYLTGTQCLCNKPKKEGKHSCRKCFKEIDTKRNREGSTMIEARIKYFEELLGKSDGISIGNSET